MSDRPIWTGLDETPEEARADAERRARAIREREAGSGRFYNRIEGGTCSTSGVETTDPFLDLRGDTGEAGALASCTLCGARLRLLPGVPRARFPAHRGGEVEP